MLWTTTVEIEYIGEVTIFSDYESIERVAGKKIIRTLIVHNNSRNHIILHVYIPNIRIKSIKWNIDNMFDVKYPQDASIVQKINATRGYEWFIQNKTKFHNTKFVPTINASQMKLAIIIYK